MHPEDTPQTPAPEAAAKKRFRGRPRRTVYYSDPLKDDFVKTPVEPITIDGSFPYIHRGRLWRGESTLLWLLLLPVVWLINHLWFGVRVRNRKALRGLRKQGFFLFGNHTQAFSNATMPTLLAFPRRAYVLANPDAVSIPFLRFIVQMLGAFPVADTLSGQRAFLRAMEVRVGQKGVFAVYPEAHIWPYYTGVRPFPSGSFAYPVRFGKPVVACAVTYRRRLLRFLPPALTLTLSEPLFPDPDAAPGAERERLCREVFRFLSEMAEENEVEYVRYVQRGDAG